jgi:hypothetical protein
VTKPLRSALASTILVTLLAACGGDSAVTTTTAGVTTSSAVVTTTTTTLPAVTSTTLPPTTTTTTEAGFGIDDIPQACYDIIVELLQLYEPAVSGVDWENATIDDHFQLMIDLGGASIDSTEGCDDVEGEMSDAAGEALLIEIARLEAPGAVGYFEAMYEIDRALEGRGATGDCLTDIASMDVIVAEGVKWLDLPLPEQVLVLGLMSSIGFCSLQTQGAFISRPDVAEFFEGSPFG